MAKSGQIGDNQNDIDVIEIKESKLTDSQKELLIADFVKQYNTLPDSIKEVAVYNLQVFCKCKKEKITSIYCSICDNDE